MDADFMALVRRMRQKQREYFRTRDRTVLEESVALEHEVDAQLDHEQHSLFPEEKP